ncbi:MAG: hypothetical protein HYU66_19895 [Armatimonadetes bacterium]|nr:hypothetical protein [Armatimonadota bacterium]
MLVCSKCGTAVRMAGHACPKCGNRGAVLDRVYKGAPRESAESPATVQVEPAEPPEPVLPEASASGGLPDAQRAWSPWLAVVVGVLFGPAAAVLVAGRNLARFRPGAPDPWLAMICVAVLQLGTGLLAGWIARSSMGYALGLWGGVWLLVLGITVRGQWRPVAAQWQRNGSSIRAATRRAPMPSARSWPRR